MTEGLEITAKKDDTGKTVKDFLRREVGLSSTLIKKVKFGGVSINGVTVTMRAILKDGDLIKVVFPEENSENVEPIPHPLNVLYEDDYLLAVNKPKNMPVHPSRANSLITLANATAAYLARPFVFRAVNRLDRDTSGIVIIAKTQYACARLCDDMKKGNFEKYYTALLSSAPDEKEGFIDAPIRRVAEGDIQREVREDGKRALTYYKIRKILPDGRAIADVRLYTGRTHQIRVHFAHIGCPLYADFLYGERVSAESYSLACTKIVFPHPKDGRRIEICADAEFDNIQ